MEIKILPLSPETLHATIDLVTRVFPYESEEFIKKTITEGLNFTPRTFNEGVYTTHLSYFTAIDESSGKVIGTTGIYTMKVDEYEAAWISWFCVDPDYRARGIGKQLLEFTISKAKEMNKNFLRVYTELHPNEFVAHKLYERYGFQDFKPPEQIKIKGHEKIIYKQLKLA